MSGSRQIERFSGGPLDTIFPCLDGEWVKLSDHLARIEELEAEREEAEDRFEFCDNCERPSREEDLKVVWCREAESGEAVDARICAVCRLQAERDEAEQALSSLRSKVEGLIKLYDEQIAACRRPGLALTIASAGRLRLQAILDETGGEQ